MLCLSGFELYSRWVPLSFENLILAKWNSMRHVDKKYRDDPDPLFPECAHEDDIEPRKWIEKGTFDYLRIKLLVK